MQAIVFVSDKSKTLKSGKKTQVWLVHEEYCKQWFLAGFGKEKTGVLKQSYSKVKCFKTLLEKITQAYNIVWPVKMFQIPFGLFTNIKFVDIDAGLFCIIK